MRLTQEQCELYTRGLDKYVPDDLLDTIDALNAELAAQSERIRGAVAEWEEKVNRMKSLHTPLDIQYVSICRVLENCAKQIRAALGQPAESGEGKR